MEVCTLSRQGNRFIPYPPHYRTAFAFSIILYPLRQQITLRSPLSAILAGRRVGLTTFHTSNRVGKVPSFRRWSHVSVFAPSKRTTDHMPFGRARWNKLLLAQSSFTTFINGSLALTNQLSLAPHSDATAEITPRPLTGYGVPRKVATLSERLAPHRYQWRTAPRLQRAEPPVQSASCETAGQLLVQLSHRVKPRLPWTALF